MRARNEYHPRALFPETHFFQLDHSPRYSQTRHYLGTKCSDISISGGCFTLESQCLLWWVCNISLNHRHSPLIYRHNMIMLNMFPMCHLLIHVVEHGTTFSSGRTCREHSLLLYLPFLIILVYAENCPDVFHSLWCLEGLPIPSCLGEDHGSETRWKQLLSHRIHVYVSKQSEGSSSFAGLLTGVFVFR